MLSGALSVCPHMSGCTWHGMNPEVCVCCKANVEHARLQASGAGNAPAEVEGLEVASPFTANVWEVSSPLNSSWCGGHTCCAGACRARFRMHASAVARACTVMTGATGQTAQPAFVSCLT